MTSSLNYLTQIQNRYVQDLPDQIMFKTAQGFVATAGISLIYGAAANTALTLGAIAATATLIEAVSRPIIRSLFANTALVTFFQISLPKMAAFALARSIAPWTSAQVASRSLSSLITWVMINYGATNPFTNNIAMAEVL